ncbi:PLDc N-terminal domain-containing protein [Curtobacterium sp. L1-20]|uniref:PLDc N-terminal domain-containing protein n=1 Tax=Curtobacterium sp. L1-20 TaxID=3138181 RepID=UPI003B52EF2D
MNNALVPQQYDMLWTVVLVALLALIVAAIVSVLRNRARMSVLATTLWIVGILIFPFLGSLMWFAAGRRDLHRRSTPLSN